MAVAGATTTRGGIGAPEGQAATASSCARSTHWAYAVRVTSSTVPTTSPWAAFVTPAPGAHHGAAAVIGAVWSTMRQPPSAPPTRVTVKPSSAWVSARSPASRQVVGTSTSTVVAPRDPVPDGVAVGVLESLGWSWRNSAQGTAAKVANCVSRAGPRPAVGSARSAAYVCSSPARIARSRVVSTTSTASRRAASAAGSSVAEVRGVERGAGS